MRGRVLMTRKRNEKPRVFCIGWHKTGTSSLGHALVQLGYSVLGCRLDMVHPLRQNDIDVALELAGQFDALQDVPWAALYAEIDQAFPGSRFILTEREEQSWLRSALHHFDSADIPLHEWLYGEGVMRGNEQLYLDRYRRHNREVRAYFTNRQDDLLVLDLAEGNAWTELCGFLRDPVPNRAFPHANKGPQSLKATDRLVRLLRRWTPPAARKAIFSARQAARDTIRHPDPRDVFNNMIANREERKRWKHRESS